MNKQPKSSMARFLSLLLLCVIAIGSMPHVNAQMVGFTAEQDTLFSAMDPGDPLEALSLHGVYSVYANFTSPEDVLGALYSDVAALQSPPMGIEAPCGCFNENSTSILVSGINPAFFSVFPELEFASFWTFGMETIQSEGSLPSTVGIGGPEELCAGFNITDGAIFLEGSEGNWSENAVAGDDLKILVARITTCGDFSIQACAQVYVGGSQDTTCCVQKWCPPAPLLVTHVVPGCTDQMACNYDILATQDDNSCFFASEECDDMNELTLGDVYQQDCDCQGYSCYDPFACNFNVAGVQDDDLCEYVPEYEIVGSTNPFSSTLQEYTYSGASGSTYEWTVEGGSITDGNGTDALNVVWTEAGQGEVCVTETTEDGCVGSEVCLDVFVVLSSVGELPQGELSLFPNPAQDWLQLAWTGQNLNNAHVILRDATGRIVKAQQVSEQETLDVSSLTSGTYHLEFTAPDYGTIQRQVVIQ